MKAKKQFLEWLKEITPYGRTKEYIQIVADRSHGLNMRVRLYTCEHIYSISAKKEEATDVSKEENYLGCVAVTRKPRAGEKCNRGNDLPDGKFTRETWESIKNAIVCYELVKLAPKSKPREAEESKIPPKE